MASISNEVKPTKFRKGVADNEPSIVYGLNVTTGTEDVNRNDSCCIRRNYSSIVSHATVQAQTVIILGKVKHKTEMSFWHHLPDLE